MVGLEEVKAKYKQIVTTAKFKEERIRQGLKVGEASTNIVMEGPPGGGKTESAKLLATALFQAGALPGKDGQPVFVNESPGTLKGAHIGDSEKKMIDAWKRAEGGVLFIDEANAWADPTNKYGVAALQTLMKLTSDNPRHATVILAGYPDTPVSPGLRKALATVDPGMSRRFPELVNYRELTPQEKAQVSIRALKATDYRPTPKAKKLLDAAMAALPGQGGEVMNFNARIQDSIAARWGRSKKPEKFNMKQVRIEDVQYAIERYRDEEGDPLFMQGA